jgi:peroxiredoxin
MLKAGEQAPLFSLTDLDGDRWSLDRPGPPVLLFFFETDCPTCRLTVPYLNRLATALAGRPVGVVGISQDPVSPTLDFARELSVRFPVLLDREMAVSRLYDPTHVPGLFLIDAGGSIVFSDIGFDKATLNSVAREMGKAVGNDSLLIADDYDGAPRTKPGCSSRHLEPVGAAEDGPLTTTSASDSIKASRIELPDDVDPYDYCMESGFADPLPVVPPTVDRVRRFLKETSLPPTETVALIPPNYGRATVEKIAANAVMAGCSPEMIGILIPLVRAVCDERFNIHGIQATTHFAAPLIIINGPIRQRMGFACGSNVFSNVARANSTLGRALQLILTNLGGARPGEIDMSTLGNPGKFSYCIAENEEESPWEPLHVELGFEPNQSTLTLFAAEPPGGVSEHSARTGAGVLKAISRSLATVFSYRVCAGVEAVVVLCPEHARTLERDGFDKRMVRQFLFENTGIPIRAFQDGEGEGSQYVKLYKTATIDGEDCYLKFPDPSAIKIIVAGGTAGKFSAVIGSWAAGPRGSQMVTYPIPET